MASVEGIFQSSGFRNWVKAFIAMRLTKDGLETFVQNDLKQYMEDLLQSIYSHYKVEEGTMCNSCTTLSIIPCPTRGYCRHKTGICQLHGEAVPEKKLLLDCPRGICHRIRAALYDSHRYSSPNWNNTDATRWCTSLIEIAKCYIASGYKDKSDLDLNAIISVILNKKSFGPKMKADVSSKNEEENVCKKVLQMGNRIRHSANLDISDKELEDYIYGLVDILSDSACLAYDEKAKNAVYQLEMMFIVGAVEKTLIISEEQGKEALKDAMEVLNCNDKKNSGKNFGNEDSATISVDLEHHVNSSITDDLDLEVSKLKISKNTSDMEITSDENIPKNIAERKVSSTKDAEVQLSKNASEVSSQQDTEGKLSKNTSDQEISSTGNASNKNVSTKNDVDIHFSDDIPNKEVSFSKDTDEQYSENDADDDFTKRTKNKTEFFQILKEIKHELSGRGRLPISDIDTILAAKLNALEEIRKAKEDNISALNRQGEKIQSELLRERELRQDLSTFYRNRYGTISISPLVKAHDVPLVDLYIQQTLEYVDITNTLEGTPADLKIHSYEELFFCETSSYKEIYVTAKAGIGKTSFAKRICMTWCQAHSPLKQFENSFDVTDIRTLKKFDFLFMILLKETKPEECNIDAMIFHLVENQLKSKGRYSESLIDDILRNKRVLVILDGLDEWAHPEKCQQKAEVIPHRRPCLNCSVITTTRPWKLASAKLRNSQINMHAELLEFDETSSKKLVDSAVNFLNKTYKRSKSPEVFPKEVSLELLGALRFIPYILLQVICLLYDGLSIGKSQCEIYSNALELTLSREGHIESTRTLESNTIPKCLAQNMTCMTLYKMLLNLGKLAFEAVYSSTSESTLLFDEDFVKQYISEDDLQLILNKGLLSQNKDSSKVASWKTYFLFQHKSIQEYFAALYIQAAFPENDDISEKIFQRHGTLESVLEMSNVFIFLGGFNSDVCGQLLQVLKGILSSDAICQQYRNYLSGRTSSPEKRKCWEIIKSFQIMQIDILQEVSRNGAGDCHLYLEDLVLDDSFKLDMLNLLEVVVKENKNNLKSVSIEQCPSRKDLAEKLRMFQLQSSKNLQKLDITAVPYEDDLLHLMSNSERTIVSLDLCYTFLRATDIKQNIQTFDKNYIDSSTYGKLAFGTFEQYHSTAYRC